MQTMAVLDIMLMTPCTGAHYYLMSSVSLKRMEYNPRLGVAWGTEPLYLQMDFLISMGHYQLTTS